MQMKDFDWSQFTQKIAIKAPMQVLYNAWAIPEEIERWFLSKANYYDQNGADLPKDKPVQAENTFHWYWYGYDGMEENKIITANGKNHIQFHFAGECVVDVTLETLEDHTIVYLTQSSIPLDDNSKKDIRLGCASGWSFFLLNLKSFYEGNFDLRNKDPKIKGVINS